MLLQKRKNVLFLLCWVAYMATYICRLNFSAAMPELIRYGVFDNTQAAAISSCLFITYGAGQIFSGFLCDRINPKWMVFFGVLLSSVCNIILFFVCENFIATIILWGINGIAQSNVWAPVLRVGALYFSGPEKDRFGVNLSTTVPSGTLASYVVSLLAIRFFDYRAVFLACGLPVFAVACIWLLGYHHITAGLSVCQYDRNTASTQVHTQKMSRAVLYACVAALVVIALPTAIHGALKDGVTGWVPVFIGERFSVTTDFSLMLTMFLPVVNVTGAYIAKFVNRFIRNELLSSMLFFLVALAALAVLLFWGDLNMVLSVVSLAVITNSMFAINILLITLIPLRFARYGKTGTITGLLNAVTYLGCGGSMLYSGVLLDHSGWHAVLLLWMALFYGSVFSGKMIHCLQAVWQLDGMRQ